MKRKAVLGIMLTLLFIGILSLTFDIQQVEASGTIYIKADGNIEGTTDIMTVDNVTYTFTDNINDGIIVERDNIVLDGAGYTVQGLAPYGIDLSGRSNVTIKNTEIKAFNHGIVLYNSSNNTVSGNNMAANNFYGIWLEYSSNNTIYGNNITANNDCGIELVWSSNNSVYGNNITNNEHEGVYLYESSNNKFYHNNFIGNIQQVYIYTSGYANFWDDGYPSGGNYWSNYTGVDANGDGIGDTPYMIDANNTDRYPLIHRYGSVHNLNTSGIYLTIQSAIDAPETLDGHTIFVEAGTYVENVVVDKTVLLIGESRETTFIDANGTGNVIDVKADGVVIERFTIQNSGYDASGIQIKDLYKQATIRNNNIINNDLGINIGDSLDNNVSGNYITNNWAGIILHYSLNNQLRNNHMIGNRFNFFVWSDWPVGYDHDIDSSNTVDGKPMYYWVNQQNRTVPIDAGYVALVYSVNITAQNLDLKNNSQGLLLVETRNSTITGNNLTNNRCGIHLSLSLNNTIFGNRIMNNGDGVLLEDSVNNTIFENKITNNYCGVDVSGFWVPATNNTIYHNNFIDNTQQVYISTTPRPPNFWDNGLEGNYWSNYTGVDSDHDGIGDTTHEIDADNVDNYPLMGMFSDFNATSEHHVQTICNSTISDFHFNGTAICFNVTGENDTTGFCRICIPRALMNETYKVFVNGTEVPCNLLPCSNSTHSYLYFTYNHSTEEVIVVPEFPTWTSMLLIFTVLTVAIAIYKRRLETASR